MEETSGTAPTIHNLEPCMRCLRLLHEAGIIHGDINKYNS